MKSFLVNGFEVIYSRKQEFKKILNWELNIWKFTSID